MQPLRNIFTPHMCLSSQITSNFKTVWRSKFKGDMPVGSRSDLPDDVHLDAFTYISYTSSCVILMNSVVKLCDEGAHFSVSQATQLSE